jgi:hypothetical protein
VALALPNRCRRPGCPLQLGYSGDVCSAGYDFIWALNRLVIEIEIEIEIGLYLLNDAKSLVHRWSVYSIMVHMFTVDCAGCMGEC